MEGPVWDGVWVRCDWPKLVFFNIGLNVFCRTEVTLLRDAWNPEIFGWASFPSRKVDFLSETRQVTCQSLEMLYGMDFLEMKLSLGALLVKTLLRVYWRVSGNVPLRLYLSIATVFGLQMRIGIDTQPRRGFDIHFPMFCLQAIECGDHAVLSSTWLRSTDFQSAFCCFVGSAWFGQESKGWFPVSKSFAF